MKPIIGIVGRCSKYGEDNFNNIMVSEKIRKCIIAAGGVPIMIMPPQLIDYEDSEPSKIDKLSDKEKDILVRQLQLCDGILLPGGLKRFEYDIFILNYVLEKNIPILGICLGMQILTMLSKDGKVVLNLEKINSNIKHNQKNVNLVHEVILDHDSKLFDILKVDKFMVNSRHNMMVTDPATFTVYGHSSDGVIEEIERHDKKFAIGVQWHPEMMVSFDDKQQLIFDSFVKSCIEE